MVPAPNAGSIRFTPLVLIIYDWYVIRISAPRIWKCSTKKFLLPFFVENFSKRHLDIGVGNGYFPITALTNIQASEGAQRNQHITLVDLSQHSLDSAKKRILSHHPKVDIRTVLADAVKPMPAALAGEKFDSASQYLLLHHMPGPTAHKAQAFRVAKQHLTDDGVLFGATVLSKVWEKTPKGYRVKAETKVSGIASFALGFYNKRGVFDNYGEDPGVFEDVLRQEFEEVETHIVGMVFFFKARRPRK
ncbi:hypothetical protein B0J13DRAFT_541226 [Dactylonectria estremocensis]|uniref:Methyltransferase type 12 domain-containing protein n=1 Tax=Dactylonectria estremocensis TaxID=1079267 RepID=A0A9P9JCN2_9HYPO|nr:hypothetical protein B0J13DRAFT_541226 [Dactylonectria estremocensis]